MVVACDRMLHVFAKCGGLWNRLSFHTIWEVMEQSRTRPAAFKMSSTTSQQFSPA